MTSIKKTISLELIDIARPCPADWNAMRGNERVRFCDECNLHVYNISAMSRDAAQNLIASHSGRLCVRMYRRGDGTVITDDCSRVRAVARRTAHLAGAAATLLLGTVLTPIFVGLTSERGQRPAMSGSFNMLAMVQSWFRPFVPAPTFNMSRAVPLAGTVTMMGDMAPTTRPTTARCGAIGEPTFSRGRKTVRHTYPFITRTLLRVSLPLVVREVQRLLPIQGLIGSTFPPVPCLNTRTNARPAYRYAGNSRSG